MKQPYIKISSCITDIFFSSGLFGCRALLSNLFDEYIIIHFPENGGCQPYWDTVLCWPKTIPGAIIKKPCPNLIHSPEGRRRKQRVPHGYIRCDYFIITRYIMVYYIKTSPSDFQQSEISNTIPFPIQIQAYFRIGFAGTIRGGSGEIGRITRFASRYKKRMWSQVEEAIF